MGSLPDLAERTRAPSRAARTISDPHRHRAILAQLPVSTICRKEWLWLAMKPRRGTRGAAAAAANTSTTHTTSTLPATGTTHATSATHANASRRRDSAASSVGAASVRRLLARPPARIPRPAVARFTLLCVSSGLCATALLPFTAFAGAEAAAIPLAIMHAISAAVAPFSPLILQKTGTRLVVTLAHMMVFLLLTAHTVETPLAVLQVLYAACGAALSPMYLALAASAAALAQAAGDEARRKVALRRGLRALRAAQDAGLVVGALMLGAALLIWPEELQMPPMPFNTSAKWPSEDYFAEEDYEERTCGSAGCPATVSSVGTALTAAGRRALVAAWAALALAAIGLGVYGATSAPSPPPDARPVLRDPRALLGAPMGLFIGMQQGFIYTSYIKWYAVCVGGWVSAWRALAGAGILAALAAGTLSMAAARGRRGALAAGGAAAHASLVLALLQWRAARTDLALPAVAAAAWGACAALWDVLQAGICIGGGGWRGPWAVTLGARHAGLALACWARHAVCARAQLAALAAALVAALTAHAALELRLRRGAEAARHRS